MRISGNIILIGLLVLFFGATNGICAEMTDLGFGDLKNSDDGLGEQSGTRDESFAGDYSNVKKSVLSLDTEKGSIDDDAIAALLLAIEARLNTGKSIVGDVTINDKEVLLSEELNRQLEIWEEASRKVIVSPKPELGLASMTHSEFVEKSSVNSKEFNDLFKSVIDTEKFADEKTQKAYSAHKYTKVANLYKAIADDVFSYNNSCYLASNATDFEVSSKAKASASVIEERMKTYVDTLKRVLIKG